MIPESSNKRGERRKARKPIKHTLLQSKIPLCMTGTFLLENSGRPCMLAFRVIYYIP